MPRGNTFPKSMGSGPSLREGTARRRPIQGEPGRTGRLTPALYSTLAYWEGVTNIRAPSQCAEEKPSQQTQTPATVPLLPWENSQENI